MRNPAAKLRRILLPVLAVLAVLVLLSPFALDRVNASKEAAAQTEAGKWESSIQDRVGLLMEREEQELLADMKPITAFCPIVLETVSRTYSSSTALYAEAQFNHLFPQRNGILFLIDMEHRMLWIQKADSNSLLTTEKCLSITDNAYRDASKGEYFKCAKNVIHQIAQTMCGRSIPEPMKHLSNLVLALCISLFGVFLYVSRGTGVLMPGKVYQFGPEAERELNFHNVKQSYLRTIVHSASSDGSGGGGGSRSSGGGGGGGGGSSGGGHGF